jgi:hypothetical protein
MDFQCSGRARSRSDNEGKEIDDTWVTKLPMWKCACMCTCFGIYLAGNHCQRLIIHLPLVFVGLFSTVFAVHDRVCGVGWCGDYDHLGRTWSDASMWQYVVVTLLSWQRSYNEGSHGSW